MSFCRFVFASIIGVLMAICVYCGLFQPLWGNPYLWISLCFLLYCSSLYYLAFFHHSSSLAQYFSPSIGILFLLFCASLLSLSVFAIIGAFYPHLMQTQTLFNTILLSLVILAILYAFYKALQPPHLYTQNLTISKLSTPLKILQISDLHIGGKYLTDTKLFKIINQCNQLQADIICLTGDIIDASPQEAMSAIKLLGKLKAKYGVFYVLGNHEYFYNLEQILQTLQSLGIKTLINENFVLEIDSKPILNIAGIADLNAEKYQKLYPQKQMIFPDMHNILQALNSTVPSILLSHQPKVIDLLPSPSPFSLILSGHTHGGQIFPFNFLVKLEQPFVKGFHTLGDTHIYINQGTAFWGIPMRLGSECEITLFELN